MVQPMLAITKTGPATALLNAEFEYTITVTNNGDGDATGTTVVDTLPAGLEYVSSDPAGTVSGSTVTWNVGDLDPAGSSNHHFDGEGHDGRRQGERGDCLLRWEHPPARGPGDHHDSGARHNGREDRTPSFVRRQPGNLHAGPPATPVTLR